MAKQQNSQDYRKGGTPGSKEDQLACHQERVKHAVQWRKDAKYDETWSNLIKLYANKYEYQELSSYDDVVAPNMLFSTANVIIPGVSVNYPKITVKARKEEMAAAAMTVEAMANYEWQRNEVHEEFRLAIKDFVVVGHGICKTTWLYEETQEDWADGEYQQHATDLVMGLMKDTQDAQNAGEDTSQFPTPQDVISSIPAQKTVVKEDRPNVGRISPFDFFIDPDATRMKGALWVAERMYVPIDVAKANPAWKASARKDISPVAMSSAKKDIDLTYDGETRGEEANYAVVWEYYDLVKNTVCTFAEGADDYLSAPEKVAYPFPHPYVMIRNYDVPDKLYPIGDLENLFPLQMELALTRTQMINDRKRFRRMYMVRPDDLGEDGMDALEGGDDNAFVEVSSDRPFNEILQPVQTTQLPTEFYNQTSMILEDINLVSGVSEYQRGNQPEIRRTATEASMINDGANARSADKLATVERAIGQIAEHIVKLTQEFLTTDSVARVVGPNGSATWQQYTADDLRGEYDFSVEAGSTQPQNESTRRQAALQLMDAMAPYIGTVVDPRKMAEYILREGFGVQNPMDFMIDPMAQMQAGINPDTGQPMPPGMPPGPGGPVPPGAPAPGGQPQMGAPSGPPAY